RSAAAQRLRFLEVHLLERAHVGQPPQIILERTFDYPVAPASLAMARCGLQQRRRVPESAGQSVGVRSTVRRRSGFPPTERNLYRKRRGSAVLRTERRKRRRRDHAE